METRIDALGQSEVKIQPKGLPAIWVEMYCDRCREFQECLGFKALSQSEWEDVNNILSTVNSFPKLKSNLKKQNITAKFTCNTLNELIWMKVLI